MTKTTQAKKTKAKPKPTKKMLDFVSKYIECGNASEAYRFAYDADNMNQASIWRAARRLKENPLVAPLIEKAFGKLEIRPTETLNRLYQGQQFNMRLLYNEDGKLKQPNELDDDTAMAIENAVHDSDGKVIEYKTMGVKACSELIGRHLKLFTDKREVIDRGPVFVANMEITPDTDPLEASRIYKEMLGDLNK